MRTLNTCSLSVMLSDLQRGSGRQERAWLSRSQGQAELRSMPILRTKPYRAECARTPTSSGKRKASRLISEGYQEGLLGRFEICS